MYVVSAINYFHYIILYCAQNSSFSEAHIIDMSLESMFVVHSASYSYVVFVTAQFSIYSRILSFAEIDTFGWDGLEQVLKLSATLARHLLSLQNESVMARLVGYPPLLFEQNKIS